MAKSPETPIPTEAELRILSVLWKQGPATVRVVNAELNRDHQTGYTTTLKLLQVMNQKGLVTRDERNRTHVYSAAQPEPVTQRQMTGDLLDRLFRGSASTLVMRALEAGRTSAEELAEIRKLIARHESRGKR